MVKPLLMVSSLTYAMKGRDILNAKGFSASIVRTPKKMSKNGCGYSIRINGNLSGAENILRSNGVQVIGIIRDGAL